MTKIYTVNDLLNAAADALRSNDTDTLDGLRQQVEDWLQTREERDAQMNLLDAIDETLVALEDAE